MVSFELICVKVKTICSIAFFRFIFISVTLIFISGNIFTGAFAANPAGLPVDAAVPIRFFTICATCSARDSYATVLICFTSSKFFCLCRRLASICVSAPNAVIFTLFPVSCTTVSRGPLPVNDFRILINSFFIRSSVYPRFSISSNTPPWPRSPAIMTSPIFASLSSSSAKSSGFTI